MKNYSVDMPLPIPIYFYLFTVFSQFNAGGRLFKAQLPIPGVYSGPSVYFLSAFFSHLFFCLYWRFTELRTKF